MNPLASQDSLAVDSSALAVGFQETRVGPATIVRNHEAVLRFTEQVFPGAKIVVEEGRDPESGEDEFFVIDVTTPGEVNDLVAKHREWHGQLRKVAPETAGYYRLTLGVP